MSPFCFCNSLQQGVKKKICYKAWWLVDVYQDKRQEKIGSKVRLGCIQPDGQRPSQSYLCMEAVPRD